MFYAVLFGFLSGVAIGSLFSINLITVISIFSLSIFCFIYGYLKKFKNYHLVCLFILFLSIGAGRIFSSDLYLKSKLQNYISKNIEMEGVIISYPDRREKSVKYILRVERINSNQEFFEISEKILLSAPLYPQFQYGDKISARVSLSLPKEIENEDGRSFDYKGYLRARGIWYTGRAWEVKLVSSGNGTLIKSQLFKTKKIFTESFERVLPEPESSLLGGLILGSKRGLGDELLTDFQRTGTSHIVVLSGYNIAIIADSIISFLGKIVSSSISFFFGIIGIILFIILSGAEASSVRAGIMVVSALIAKKFNRDYKAGKILGLAMIIMLVPNPLLLVFDPSFQLSILATLGLVFVSPIVSVKLKSFSQKISSFMGEKNLIGRLFKKIISGEIISTTIATQITVLPYLIYSTGLFSIVSLPVNLLILGLIPATMFSGFITGMIGIVSYHLSFLSAIITYTLLWYVLTVIDWGSSIPFSAISLPSFSIWLLLPVYILIILIIFKHKKIN